MTFPNGGYINVSSGLGGSNYYSTTGSAAIMGSGGITNNTSGTITAHLIIDFKEYGGIIDFGDTVIGPGGDATWGAPPNGDGTVSWY